MNELVKLFLFMFVCVGIAWVYENTYIKTFYGTRKSRFLYFILMTFLICYGGFRGQYNDTWTYRNVYTYVTYPFPEAWDYIPTQIGESPAYVFLNSLLKTYDVEVHLYLFFYFFWTLLFFMQFIKNYRSGFALTIFFFFTTGCYQFNMAAMKQVLATAICLAAFPLALRKDWKSRLLYVFLVGLATLFHAYAFMYLAVFFLNFKPWSKGTYILLFGLICGGFLFQPLLGTVIDITTAIGENYTVEALSGDGISTIRLCVSWIPIVLSIIYRRILFDDCASHERVIFHLTLIFAGIQFVGLFGTALYFGRLSYYFCVMPCITLAWMLRKISVYYPKDGSLLTICAVIGYLGFFYFSNTLETDYDNSYAAISLSQFIEYFVEWVKGLST